jgi:hypothetical protein
MESSPGALAGTRSDALASGSLASGSSASGSPVPVASAAVGALMADTIGDVLELAVVLERMIAQLTGWRAETIEQARRWSVATEQAISPGTPGSEMSASARARMARRVVVSEVACALRISERAADVLVAESKALVNDLPATMGALRSGAIGYRQARTIVDNVATLSDADRAELERLVLPVAAESTPGIFDRRVRAVREKLDPGSSVARHSHAVVDRRVECTGGRDGMAWLSAYLPAVQAVAIFSRLTDAARALQATGEPRTLDQSRADLVATALLDGSGQRAGDSPEVDSPELAVLRRIRPRVLVTVPVLTLLGHGHEPAVLDGYGPIDPETARMLTADAPSMTRLLTHPETGAVLSVGRRKYRVPADLRAWLRVRDGTCRFPGCGRSAGSCDLDHTTDWQYGGHTDWHNLAHLCPKHHRLKHDGGWRATQANDEDGIGVLTWTAPSGRRYATPPAVQMAPPRNLPAGCVGRIVVRVNGGIRHLLRFVGLASGGIPGAEVGLGLRLRGIRLVEVGLDAGEIIHCAGG